MMNHIDTGYKYCPLKIARDPSLRTVIFLSEIELRNATSELTLLCNGSSNRFPAWKHNHGGFIGGFYPIFADEKTLIAFYESLQREAQIIGYIETSKGKWGASENPFPKSLQGGLPRNVWAYAYEVGSSCHRYERLRNEVMTTHCRSLTQMLDHKH